MIKTYLTTILILSICLSDVYAQCMLDSVVIQSILVDPSGPDYSNDTNNDGEVNSSDEFIEICNTATTDTVDISGWQIGDDDPPPYPDFVIPDGTYMAPGECLLIVLDYCPQDLDTTLCEVPEGVIDLDYSETALLGNDGDVITLTNADGDESCSVTYGDVDCDDVDVLDIESFDLGNCDYWGEPVDGCPLLASGDSCTYIPTILPLELLDFSLSLTDKQKVKLDWRIIYEGQAQGYSVEWKNDYESRFKELGFVELQNLDQEVKIYNFLHEFPDEGINYYRVKQIDLSGAYTYSPIRSVELEYSNKVLVYPSLFENGVYINGNSQNYLVTLFDMNGNLILEKVEKRNNEFLDLHHVLPGYYIIQIFEGSRVLNQKILKI